MAVQPTSPQWHLEQRPRLSPPPQKKKGNMPSWPRVSILSRTLNPVSPRPWLSKLYRRLTARQVRKLKRTKRNQKFQMVERYLDGKGKSRVSGTWYVMLCSLITRLRSEIFAVAQLAEERRTRHDQISCLSSCLWTTHWGVAHCTSCVGLSMDKHACMSHLIDLLSPAVFILHFLCCISDLQKSAKIWVRESKWYCRKDQDSQVPFEGPRKDLLEY